MIKLALRIDNLENSIENQDEELKKINNVFDDPDFALSLQNAILYSSRTSDEKKHEILSRIIEARLLADDSERKKLILNEAISTAPKLTQNQLQIMTILLLLKYSDFPPLKDEEYLQLFLQTHVKPFLDITDNIIDYQHIQYTGCGYYDNTVGLLQVLSRKYPLLFVEDFESNKIDILNLSDEIKNKLFYYDDKRNIYRTKISDRKEMNSCLSTMKLPPNIHTQIYMLYEAKTLNFGKFTKAIEESCDEGSQLIQILTKSPLSTFSLTSVGIAIALTYFEQTVGIKLNFDDWFSDDFSNKITKKLGLG